MNHIAELSIRVPLLRLLYTYVVQKYWFFEHDHFSIAVSCHSLCINLVVPHNASAKDCNAQWV